MFASLQSIPSRSSDAGPNNNDAPIICRESLYSLLVDEALEEVRELDRLFRDDRKREQRERLEHVAKALDALLKIREVV